MLFARPSRRNAGLLLVAAVILLAAGSDARATKYAGEPYNLGVGARALGRGGAFVASRPDASSIYWNVASLAVLERAQVLAQHAETFGSLLNHDIVAFAAPAADSGAWAWGAYATYLGGGGIQITEIDTLRGRPSVTSEESHSDWSVAFGLARKSNRWWHWGAAVKAVVRNLPGNSAYGLGADFALYGQGRGWRAGIKAADITTTFLSFDSGRKETITPHVNWGAEADLPRLARDVTGVVTFEAETYFEGRKTGAQFWSGPVSVDLHVGGEVAYRDLLFARAGSDAGRLALGAGFRLGNWSVDAALADHEFLDNSYRVSVRYVIH